MLSYAKFKSYQKSSDDFTSKEFIDVEKFMDTYVLAKDNISKGGDSRSSSVEKRSLETVVKNSSMMINLSPPK